ncbi:MAG: V-type ATPase subunit [Planctomycetota bacterium]
MSREDWCYVSGLVAALETRLLQPGFFDQLLNAASEEDLLVYLGDTELEEEFEDLPDLADAEVRIERFLRTRLMDVRSFCPEASVVDMVFAEADFLNFKAVGKSALLGIEEPFSAAGSIPQDRFRRIWEDGESDGVMWDELAKEVKTRIEEMDDKPFAIDLIVDKAHLRFIENCAERLESPLATNYARLYCAWKKATVLYRARTGRTSAAQVASLFLDEKDAWLRPILNGAEKDMMNALRSALSGRVFEAFQKAPQAEKVFVLEDAGGKDVMSTVREAKGFAYGPEPVLGYVCGLVSEAANLKLAVGSVLNRLPTERVRPKLRAVYVQ